VTVIEEFLDEGVRTFLALRGDPPTGADAWQPHPGGLTRASELVELIREVEQARCGASASQALRGAAHKLSIAVAAFPTGHPGPESVQERRASDLRSLLAKQEAGADFAITQVFFDPRTYLDLVRDARAVGVSIPILAGVIPTTDPARLLRVEQLTGVTVPAELLGRLLATDDEDERHRIGIRASVDLANAVLDGGAPGLHVYTFNRHRAALALVEGAGLADAPVAGPSRPLGPPPPTPLGTAPLSTTPLGTAPLSTAPLSSAPLSSAHRPHDLETQEVS
jgi:methylenetetrahydrofolate reductase (NADPH)